MENEPIARIYGIILLLFMLPTAYFLGTTMFGLTETMAPNEGVEWFFKATVLFAILTAILIVPGLAFLGRMPDITDVVKGLFLLLVMIPISNILTITAWNIKDVFLTGTTNMVFAFLIIIGIITVSIIIPQLVMLGEMDLTGIKEQFQ